MKKPTKNQTVILIVLQGRPLVISGDDGNPYCFADIDAAREWTCEPTMVIQAAESILIVDMATGETESL